MNRDQPLPKYQVLQQTPEGWTLAEWPEGTPAWNHGPNEERARDEAIRNCLDLAELHPDAVLIAVDPENVEIARAKPTTEPAPF